MIGVKIKQQHHTTLMLPLMSDFTGAKAVGPKTSGQEETINIEYQWPSLLCTFHS